MNIRMMIRLAILKSLRRPERRLSLSSLDRYELVSLASSDTDKELRLAAERRLDTLESGRIMDGESLGGEPTLPAVPVESLDLNDVPF